MQCSCSNDISSSSATTNFPYFQQFDNIEDEYTTTQALLQPSTTPLNQLPLCSTNITEKRYITSYAYNGRFGNMIFRCASLYGIAKTLNRYPYHSEVTEKQVGAITEFSQVFPLMSDYINIKLPPAGSEKVVNYARDACKYDPPSNLNPYNASKYLRIWGIYLQSWKYFEDYKSDIRKLLECSPMLKDKAKVEAPIMWKNDSSSHKLCVHIRRGDFKQYRTFLVYINQYIF
uniref:Uncharacterized protein n=1 Tax=Panagrolaimus sp. ES5 TaxID=591445 RepID=A0AC34F8W6_9BILA